MDSAPRIAPTMTVDVLINSQTPLVQFIAPKDVAGEALWADSAEIGDFTEGADFRYSPGGVTRMVYPLVRRLISQKVVGAAHWVSLNPTGPRTLRLPGLTLHNVRLDAGRMSGYGRAKEAIWSAAHGLDPEQTHPDLFWSEEFAEYAFYGRRTARRIRELDRDHDFDLFYIHDFQQLPVGEMLDTMKPKIFRWHIPFDAARIPEEWRAAFVRYLGSYDVVVVSSEAYRRGLERLGFRGKTRLQHPYIDPGEYSRPSREEADREAARFGLGPTDIVALVVARMDPAKGQDRAIAAVAELAPRHPKLKLVLIGNGSFSGSAQGVGLGKGARWREHLQKEANRLEISDRVIFAGHVPQRGLDAMYERADLTILPSVNEGFGLVVVESWLHERPVIVTRRAGIAEMIRHGHNGLLVDPDDISALASAIERIADDDGSLTRRLGRNGRTTARACSVESAWKAEADLLREVVEGPG
ncbi:MAG: glycosyltransferase family 4 protein [Thermoplasmata archaeon]